MKYVVIIESCGFKGTTRANNSFSSLKEAWNFYKSMKRAEYTYAGNDYLQVEKPFIIFSDNRDDQVNNHHHFYTVPRTRKTREYNYNKGYVYSSEFGTWISAKETVKTVTIDLFSSLEEELPF